MAMMDLIWTFRQPFFSGQLARRPHQRFVLRHDEPGRGDHLRHARIGNFVHGALYMLGAFGAWYLMRLPDLFLGYLVCRRSATWWRWSSFRWWWLSSAR
jgi:hypothetical protein